MTRARVAVALLALAACDVAGPEPAACTSLAPPELGLGLDGAREAHRRAAVRQALRYRDAIVPGSTLRATALIANERACPGDLYEAGRILFEHSFEHAEGLAAPPRRVHDGTRGGPDATSCASCHWRGGRGGGGGLPDDSYLLGDGDRPGSADARNPLALGGAGAVQALAAEMTAELHALRDDAIARVRRTGAAVDVELVAKTVSFGVLHVSPHRIDTRDVSGVDPDLVVRPFGWKGTRATIDDFVAKSVALHFGMAGKLTRGQLAAVSVYVAAQALPIDRPLDGGRSDLWAAGREVFDRLGCTVCHVPRLVLHVPVVAVGGTELDLGRDAEAPRLRFEPSEHGYPVDLYSDLRRHDLGDDNAAAHRQGEVGNRMYLTRRLWGLGDSAPYFYDGASASIDDAIRRHGGEALFARQAWSGASAQERAALRVFLAALRREPRFEVP